MSDSRFFRTANARQKERFFAAAIANESDEDSEVDSGNASSSGMLSYREMRLVASDETLEELLERLLRNIDKSGGDAQQNYLEQLLLFLNRNPELVNRVPKNFHSNPLELVIKIGDFKMAKELLSLKAMVRPENRFLLKRIAHLLDRLADYSCENHESRDKKPRLGRS